MNRIPLYKHTADYAREHGEPEIYRASMKANIECKEAIEAAIRKHFDGMHLDKAAVADVIAAYGQGAHLLCRGQLRAAERLGRALLPLQQEMGGAV